MKKAIKIFIVFVILFLAYPYGYFVLDTDPRGGGDYHGVSAYIINLDRSRARYLHVKPKIDALGVPVKRIAAVDGNTLSPEELAIKVDWTSYKEFMGHLPKLGTIGCSLSHIKAWQDFLRSNFAYAVIFEDDISFDPKKLRAVIGELRSNSKLWDVANFETLHNGGSVVVKQFALGYSMVVYLMEVTHAGGYMLNRAAAMKLLTKALPIKMPIDHYFTRSWELDLRFVGIEPRLVVQNFGDSDIGYTKKAGHYQMSKYVHFRRKIYKLHSYIIRFLYNFKVYLASKIAVSFE